MKIFFCNDGVLRLGNNQNESLLPMTMVQTAFNLRNDFEFFSRFMTHEITLEKGLTFANFIKCLAPWGDFWSMYTMTDLVAYNEYIKRPRAFKSVPYVHEIEFSHFVRVTPAHTHIINNQSIHNSELVHVLQSKHQHYMQLHIGVEFNIEQNYTLRGYTDFSPEINLDISEVPTYELLNSQMVLRRQSNVVFFEEGLKDVAENLDLNISKRQRNNIVWSNSMYNLGARHLADKDENFDDEDSISYVEGNVIFTLEQFMREAFRFLPTLPTDEHTKYSEIYRRCVDEHLAHDYGTMSKEEVEMALANKVLAHLHRMYEHQERIMSGFNYIEEKLKEFQEHHQEAKESSKILQFKPRQGKEEVSSLQQPDNNIVSMSNFKNSKVVQMPISEPTEDKDRSHVTIKLPKDPNAEIFAELVDYAQEEGIEIKERNSFYPNIPGKRRIIGILDPLSYDELRLDEFDKADFKPIEQIQEESGIPPSDDE